MKGYALDSHLSPDLKQIYSIDSDE